MPQRLRRGGESWSGAPSGLQAGGGERCLRLGASEARSAPVVAVVGLAAGCGTTTVARALAAELALRDPAGAAVVCGPPPRRAGLLVSPGAARLAREMSRSRGITARAVGRLCLLPSTNLAAAATAAIDLAPVVLDVAHGSHAGCAAALADHVALVASPLVEPSLAAVVAASLARVGPEPLIVVNRASEPGAWARRPALLLGDSRLAARRAARGRRAGAVFGAGVAELADRCEPA